MSLKAHIGSLGAQHMNSHILFFALSELSLTLDLVDNPSFGIWHRPVNISTFLHINLNLLALVNYIYMLK